MRTAYSRMRASTWTSFAVAAISASCSVVRIGRGGPASGDRCASTTARSSACGGVVDEHLEEEAVHLCFGQRVRALDLDRVLGGEHEERPRKREGAAADRDLPLFHRFEQRRLHLRWRAVDLVGEQDVGHDRAEPGDELPPVGVEDLGPGEVAGQQVGSELDARERALHRRGEAAGGEGLAEPGHALEEDVPLAHGAQQHVLDERALADHRAAHLGNQGAAAAAVPLDPLAQLGGVRPSSTPPGTVQARAVPGCRAQGRADRRSPLPF